MAACRDGAALLCSVFPWRDPTSEGRASARPIHLESWIEIISQIEEVQSLCLAFLLPERRKCPVQGWRVPEGQSEISRWRKPPVRCQENATPAGAAQIADRLATPLPGLGKFWISDRWLAPPANFQDASGVIRFTEALLYRGTREGMCWRSCGVFLRVGLRLTIARHPLPQ